jgi:uncharacterized membrane protein
LIGIDYIYFKKLGSFYLNKSTAVFSKLPSFVATILVLQVALYLSFFLDIAIARQVIGFLYLAFIPGFVIVKLLKQNNLGLAETVLFSVGLSLAFVMLAGFVVNEVGLLVGIKQPLEPSLLVLVFSGVVLLGALACSFRDSQNAQPIELTKSTFLKLSVLCLLPVLSVVGAYFANITGNTTILLLTLLMVLAVFLVALFSKRLITPKFYLIIVFIIALTLLFHSSLISNYVQGADIKIEYYIAALTHDSGFWNSSISFTDTGLASYYSMLSVTIIPTIYSNILNMDITWVFKIIYPLIFALVPLALYLIWREKFGVSIAFISVFLLMSQSTFYFEMTYLARQMIAEVFFVLLFLIIFSKSLSSKNVKILIVIFSFSLIVSHYSLALIFGFFISLIWLFTYLTKKPKSNLSLGVVVLFLVLMFSWFVITASSATIVRIAGAERSIIGGFSDFLNPVSRSGQLVGIGIGGASHVSSLYTVGKAIAYATELFIIIGFVVLLLKLKKKDLDFFIPCLASMLILVMCIVLPNFSGQFGINRFYHVILFFLAPLFAIGCIGLFRFAAKLLGLAAKRKTEICSLILMTLVLGSYFLFQTNLIYEVAGVESWSISLSRYRLNDRLYSDFSFVTGPQVSSAEWLSQNHQTLNWVTYTDTSVGLNLAAYGEIYPGHLSLLDNTTSPQEGQFYYLAELYTIYNEAQYYSNVHNASDLLGLQPLSLIYNNGLCEILTQTH